jgi:hypothetical protein
MRTRLIVSYNALLVSFAFVAHVSLLQDVWSQNPSCKNGPPSAHLIEETSGRLYETKVSSLLELDLMYRLFLHREIAGMMTANDSTQRSDILLANSGCNPQVRLRLVTRSATSRRL